MQRTYDIVLFGATGFTGQLVAHALATTARAGARIALAGRSRDKLLAVQRGLPGPGANWDLLIADSGDEASLAAVASAAKVVCTTVGPYALYGLPLVLACAKAGTHYCDLTGEVHFMRASIDKAHDIAKDTGARIVHTCGFDSIPSDLGAFVVHKALVDAGETGELAALSYVLGPTKGGFSGGTIASMKVMLDAARADKSLRRTLADPYALSPDRAAEPDLGREGDLMRLKHDADLGRWVAPFLMAPVNTRVVRRTNALLGYPYGRSFRYRELMGLPRGARGLAMGASITVGMGALVAGLQVQPTRWVLDKLLPKPGEGPDEEARRTGYFNVAFHGVTPSGGVVKGKVVGMADPGYGETAKMLSQSALCLAFDQDKTPEVAGVLTPAVAIGSALVDRLRVRGMTFEAEV